MSTHLASVEAFCLKHAIRLGIHPTKVRPFAAKLSALGQGREGFHKAIHAEGELAFDLVNQLQGDVKNAEFFVVSKLAPKAPKSAEAVARLSAKAKLAYANGDSEAAL